MSIDGGKTWNDMRGNMPTQPVYDLKIHPRDGELIVGTHGRGIFITDIAPLQQLNDKALGEPFVLFDIKPAVKWVTRIANVSASTNFNAPSNPAGVAINYYLKAAAAGDVTVQVLKGARVVAENKKAPNAAGVNRLIWNMRMDAVTIPGVAAAPQTGRGFGGGLGGGARRGRTGHPVVRRRRGSRPGRVHGRGDRRRQDRLEDRGGPRGRLVRPDVLRAGAGPGPGIEASSAEAA